jgi:hypothetical protein
MADAEADLAAFRRRAEHEMQVAGVEAVDNASVLVVELRALGSYGPVSDQWPLIELRFARGIGVVLVRHDAARGHKAIATVVADIGLGRLDIAGIGGGLRAQCYTVTKNVSHKMM